MKIAKLSILFCIVFGAFSCSIKSEKLTQEENLDNTVWINDGRELPDNDSLFYLDHPAPLFRKEFIVEGGLEEATLLITAAWYYKASLNGNKIGDDVLYPA